MKFSTLRYPSLTSLWMFLEVPRWNTSRAPYCKNGWVWEEVGKSMGNESLNWSQWFDRYRSGCIMRRELSYQLTSFRSRNSMSHKLLSIGCHQILENVKTGGPWDGVGVLKPVVQNNSISLKCLFLFILLIIKNLIDFKRLCIYFFVFNINVSR